MKSKVVILVVTLTMASLAVWAQSPAPAVSTSVAPPTKLGVIQMQQVILASNEGQRDFGALQKKFEPKQVELSNAKKELDDLQKQLSTQGNTLNDEARSTLVNNIQAKQKTYQRNLDDAQQDYQNQLQELINRIGEKMYKVLSTYAENNGYAVIFDISNPQTSAVLWAGPTVDVSKAILDAYNAQSGVAAPPKAPPSAPSATKPTTPPPTRKPQ
ncbi:MAG TPA: OmpH family outer membrane protein [Terriglobales bacterium]|nr:OmpH family outer membrane protein [Terriglobales bacterium]